MCGLWSKKSRFIRKKEASGLLICYRYTNRYTIKSNSFSKFSIKSLLAGDKFMPEMNLRQPGFIYSAYGLFTKNKERMQKLKDTGNSWCIYQNELDKACF